MGKINKQNYTEDVDKNLEPVEIVGCKIWKKCEERQTVRCECNKLPINPFRSRQI